MTRAYRRRTDTCRVPRCGAALIVGTSTTDRLIRYSLCTECCQKDCVFVGGRMARWCCRHTTFHDIDSFRGAQRTCVGEISPSLVRAAAVAAGSPNDIAPETKEVATAALRLVKIAEDTLRSMDFKKPQPWLSLGVPGGCALDPKPRRTELGELLSL